MKTLAGIMVFAALAVSQGAAAQADQECTVRQWREMVRAVLRGTNAFDPARCSNASRLVNADLGFGQRAIHFAVADRNWAFASALLAIPGIDPMAQDDDDQTALGYLLVDPETAFPDEFIRRYIDAISKQSLSEEIQRFASVCLDTFEETAALKRERMESLLRWMGEQRSEFFYAQVVSNLASTDATCFMGTDRTFATEFLTRYAPSMTQDELDSIGRSVFTDLAVMGQMLRTRGGEIRFFDAFIRHPALDRPFPRTGDKMDRSDYARRAFAAVVLSNQSALEYLVESRGYPINFQNEKEDAALFQALSFGNPAFVSWLVSYPGLKVDIRDHRRKTALHYAIEARKPMETIAVIVEAAKRQGRLEDMLSAKDNDGSDIFDWIADQIERELPDDQERLRQIAAYLMGQRP